MKITGIIFSLAIGLVAGCVSNPKQPTIATAEIIDAKLADEYYKKSFELINQSNDKEAIIWVKKAAQMGHVEAQFLLGYMIDTGKAGYTQSSQAIYWYSEAADQGNMNAQFNLGIIAENNRKIPEFYLNAVERISREKAEKLTEQNTIFIGSVLGYVDIPLVQPSSCFVPNTICMNWYVTYKIKVKEVLAGEPLSGVVHATRLQHGQHTYSGNDLSAFVVTKMNNKNTAELVNADYYLREHRPPVTQYCFSEELDFYISELKEKLSSNCVEASSLQREIKHDFIQSVIAKVEDALKGNQLLIRIDEGYRRHNVFVSSDEYEENDNCPFDLDLDKKNTAPECNDSDDEWSVVRYVVFKENATLVTEMIQKELDNTSLELNSVEMNIELIESEHTIAVEWSFRFK